MTLAEKLKNLRAVKNLTLTDLDSLSGISFVQLGRYENNKSKPSAKTLHKLAIAFNVDFSYFIDGAPKELNKFPDLDEKYEKLKTLEGVSKESIIAIGKIFDLVILESSINSAMSK